MAQPEGYEEGSNKTCHLLKTLYGLNVLNTYNLSDHEVEDGQSKVCVYKVLSVWWW